MKKALFASTALVAASLASSGFAAEKITGSVGGYMMFGLVYQDQTGADTQVGVLRDGEIFLQAKGTSDNGLTFSLRIELEAFTDQVDQIDENWAKVSGSWGEIMVGSDDTAADNQERGIFYGPGARTGYFDSFYAPLFSSNGGDVPVIRYTTPVFSGFQASADWAPNSSADGAADRGGLYICNPAVAATACPAGGGQRWSVAASWDGEFDGFSVGLGAGYVDGDVFTDARFDVGGQISFSGFSLGVHFDSAGNGGVGTQGAIAIGALYQTGPWTFGGGVAFSTSGPDTTTWGVWATYALAPGVTATLGYEGNDLNTAAAGAFNTSISAYLRMGF
jgi:outer membrane protein OmpU